MKAKPRSLPRTVRWLLPAVLLAAAPKCLLCILAYAGLGAALGIGGPEICGTSTGSINAWMPALTWLGGALGLAWGVRAARRCFHRGSGVATRPQAHGNAGQPWFTV